ncbi:protoheme IX farnesyltransferase [Trametopsis cervina]|nr:protoheme IX farnesyltransferase [Trametopsis cervina]
MQTRYASPLWSRCRQRAPGLRLVIRYSSTLQPRQLEFASFFFHNARWKSAVPIHSIKYPPPPPPLLRAANSTVVVESARPAEVASLGYRPSEVLTPRRLMKVYAQLSKSRLTTLVVLTAMGGVALSPLPTTIPVLLATAVGTALCSASANTLNQLQEVPFDAQMARTRMRPLVRRAIRPVHAASFAIATGVSGPLLLWTIVNPTTACLGLLNIALYAGPYTWLKRRTIWNTWVGAVVGAIPPLMGWTACSGHLLPSISHTVAFFPPSFLAASSVDPSLVDNPLAPLALCMVLFSWQFPHFNALSHIVRESYAQAGYQMLGVVSPLQNRLVALRHALLFVPICSILVPLSGLTTWAFALTSLVPNAIMVRAAWRFWKSGSGKHARTLFQHSLWFLPAILGLMMCHKQGMDWWSWIGGSAVDNDGEPDDT